MLKPLLFGLDGFAERSRVGVTEKVLMQRFRKKVQVSLLEPTIPFGQEFEFRSLGVFESGHFG